MNNIVKHFQSTGHDPHAERRLTQNFGYATSQSFSEALRATAEISSAFENLPSETRASFAHDPAAWLDSLPRQGGDLPEIVEPEASDEPEITSETPKSDEVDST